MLSFLKRLLLGIGALLLVLSTLLLGMLLALVLVPWALLRGRRPADVRFGWQAGPRAPGWARPAPMRRAESPDDVVDVEVRELPRTEEPPSGRRES